MKKSKVREMAIPEASDYFDEHDIFEFDHAREMKAVFTYGVNSVKLTKEKA